MAEDGIEGEQGRRHYHLVGTDGDGARKVYPIPNHNGMHSELTDAYIRGAARAFGLEPAEVFKRLRG